MDEHELVSQVVGVVADIQRASIHDGPGLRTTVFLKGCPLHCAWCHNPECISFEPEILFYPEKCIGCGKCREGCYSGARVLCGTSMTVEQLMKQILLDQDYYGKEGGVTFSGGEPLSQAAFVRAAALRCRELGIHTAVETCMFVYDAETLKTMDLIMADLKIWEDGIHQNYTGVSNQSIRKHLKQADELGIPIIGRTPVIPGIEQGIPQISAFFQSLKHCFRYELLPYHPLGVPKQAALGKPEVRFETPTRELMKELNQYAYIR